MQPCSLPPVGFFGGLRRLVSRERQRKHETNRHHPIEPKPSPTLGSRAPARERRAALQSVSERARWVPFFCSLAPRSLHPAPPRLAPRSAAGARPFRPCLPTRARGCKKDHSRNYVCVFAAPVVLCAGLDFWGLKQNCGFRACALSLAVRVGGRQKCCYCALRVCATL